MRPTATAADGLYGPHTFSLSSAKPSSRLHLMLSMAAMPVAAFVNPTLPRLPGAQLFFHGLKAYYTQNPDLATGQQKGDLSTRKGRKQAAKQV